MKLLERWKERRWAVRVAREVPAARTLYANGVTVDTLWPAIESTYWASDDPIGFVRSFRRRQPYLIAALKYIEQEKSGR